VGRYAFVAAGAVVTKDVPDYALVSGVPAKRVAWMSRHGHRLCRPDPEGVMRCPESGYRYREVADGIRCLDMADGAPVPAEKAVGTMSYRDLRRTEEQR